MDCRSLSSVVIPDSVTSIASQVFQNCYALSVCDLSGVTDIPSLGGSNAFTNTSTELKILVPSALLSQFQGATNWSVYASQMVGV